MDLDIHEILGIDYCLDNSERQKSKDHMSMVEEYLTSEKCFSRISSAVENELKNESLLDAVDLYKAVKSQVYNVSSFIKNIYETRHVSTKYEDFDKFFEENYEELCDDLSRLSPQDLFEVTRSASKLTIPLIPFVKTYHLFLSEINEKKTPSRENIISYTRGDYDSLKISNYIRSVAQWYSGKDPQGRYLWLNFICRSAYNNIDATFNEALEYLGVDKLAETLFNLDYNGVYNSTRMSIYSKLCDYDQSFLFDTEGFLNLLVNERRSEELKEFLDNYSDINLSNDSYDQKIYSDLDFARYLTQLSPETLENFNKIIQISYIKEQSILINFIEEEDDTDKSALSELHRIEYFLRSNLITKKSVVNYYKEKSLKIILEEEDSKRYNPTQLTLLAYAILCSEYWVSGDSKNTSMLLYKKLDNRTIDTDFIIKIFGHLVLNDLGKELCMAEDEKLLFPDGAIVEWLTEIYCKDNQSDTYLQIPFLNKEIYEKYILL